MRRSHGEGGNRSRDLICSLGSLVNDMFPMGRRQKKATITATMTFKRLVRFEEDGEAKFADLVSEAEDGYVVKPLNGSLEYGLEESDAETLRVTKASLHGIRSDTC